MAGKKLIKKSTVVLIAKEMGKTFAKKKELEGFVKEQDCATDQEVDAMLDDVFVREETT